MAVPYLGEEELEEKVKYYEKRGSEIKTPTILEGLDEALFEKVTVLDGELDPLFDENINAIAIRVETDDYGNVENIERYPKVGDTLTMVYQNMYEIDTRTGKPADSATTPEEYVEIREEEPREVDYTVCALVKVPYAMTFRYSGSGYDTILPAERMKEDCGAELIRKYYLFDTPDMEAENAAERYLAELTAGDTSVLMYESKASIRSEFEQFQKMFFLLGGVLCAIIGLVGILNFFNSLGVQVTVVEMMDEILGGMDKELSALLRAEYTKRGIKFLLSTRVVGLSQTEEGAVVSYENAEGNGSVIAEKLLMSVGRRPVTKGFGLENLNLEQTERGAIRVNEKMQTSVPDVYVCGDLTGFSLLAHTAVREAEVAVHSILGKEDAMSYRAIPGVVYTNPEIAGVGETEESALAKGINYQVIKLPMAYSGRFVAENEGVNGVCKVLLDEQQRVIGAHVLGNPASEIITLAGTAIELGLTAAQWKKIVFPHPTVGEIFREAL